MEQNSIIYFDKAIRYYDDGDEEEAVRVVDNILGITNMDIDDTFSLLSEWPEFGMPFENEIFTNPDGTLVASHKSGVEANLREYGQAGLIDLLQFRSKALSAIMYGNASKQKNEFLPVAVANAAVIINLFPQVEIAYIAQLWAMASQSPVVSTNDTHVEMSLYMLRAVLAYHENMRSDPAIHALLDGIFPMRMSRIPTSHKAHLYWDEVKSFAYEGQTTAKNLSLTTKISGLFNNFFKRKN